ncbi:MAG: indolepyruvate oxidoreductase subunit beta, partial [Defluviitaleaceae bacterium]|nr:indolepyruvate oxidoreductase subunit beta [Defluviitaleaceae bacterium]
GMSQREGSVETYVRYSREPICAPIIGRGGADVVLGLEALEALRAADFLKKGGKMVMNTQEIDPMPVITGKAAYPGGIPARLEGLGIEVVAAGALEIAREAGNLKAANVVMIGVLSGLPEFREDFEEEDWKEALRACVPGKSLEMNLRAFEAGRKL